MCTFFFEDVSLRLSRYTLMVLHPPALTKACNLVVSTAKHSCHVPLEIFTGTSWHSGLETCPVFDHLVGCKGYVANSIMSKWVSLGRCRSTLEVMHLAALAAV